MTVLEQALAGSVDFIHVLDVDDAVLDALEELTDLGWHLLECGCLTRRTHAIDCDLDLDCSCAADQHVCAPPQR